ncbi:hypothetical protein PROFUN_13718 [Planoprotostelium fungivorum]|uniref:Uncharacterized protein n=1 Tax=Planoprotostelium fungivorum TaxID=1890364 RepID=A0A2P6N391_9EUKA|nr:hypothetical protein PROFUN_13718 [Planoprotostelium fungivorum]
MITPLIVLFLQVTLTVASCAPCDNTATTDYVTFYYCSNCNTPTNFMASGNQVQCACGGSACLKCSSGSTTSGGGSSTCSCPNCSAIKSFGHNEGWYTHRPQLDSSNGVTGNVYINGNDDSFSVYWMDTQNLNNYLNNKPYTYWSDLSVTNDVKCYSRPNIRTGPSQGVAFIIKCRNLFQSCNSLFWNYRLVDPLGNVATPDGFTSAPPAPLPVTYAPWINSSRALTSTTTKSVVEPTENNIVVIGSASRVSQYLASIFTIIIAMCF